MEIMTSKQSNTLYMTNEEIFKNAILLTGGGAETTSSSLTGMAFILSTRPDVKQRIVEELHATFPTEDDINMRSVAQLTYTGAFIEEAMRYYPPGPNTMWRTTPAGGNTILGEYIPGNVSSLPQCIGWFRRTYLTSGPRDSYRPFSAFHIASCTAAKHTGSTRMISIPSAGYPMASAPPCLTRTVARGFIRFLTARVPALP
jgi:hypothetical protein